MHGVDTHDTELRTLLVALADGVGWIVHAAPFQASTSGAVDVDPSEEPTAVQAVAAEHETPSSVLDVLPGGVRVAWIVQLRPSQRSASGSVTPPVDVLPKPTAVHAVADEHDTP